MVEIVAKLQSDLPIAEASRRALANCFRRFARRGREILASERREAVQVGVSLVKKAHKEDRDKK